MAMSILRRWASSAVFLEHNGSQLIKANLAAIKAAKKTDPSGTVCGVLIVSDSKILEQAKQLPGLTNLILVSTDSKLSESTASIIKEIQEKHSFSHWFAVHSTTGKDLMPRFAALLGSKQAAVADIVGVQGENTFIRPIYAGNAIAEVETDKDAVKVVTVRSTAFQQEQLDSTKDLKVETADIKQASSTLSVWEGEEAVKSERPELGSAEIIISGGRALKSAENFKIVYDLADKLKAAVGASRAAVDAGYVPNELQVGQTGKVVAPRLYVAIGISGAIQHVAGMKDSQVIVAINKDADSPIFKIADYGLVGDLFKIVPELTDKIAQK